jgi:hypothetical protein
LTTALIIIGLLFALGGIVGSVAPIIPGPFVSYLSLIILSYARDWGVFSANFLIFMAGAALVVTLLDYVVAAGGAKRCGASRSGIWGSVIGMFIGIFFLPPWGMFVGALAGAVIGELLTGKGGDEAMRAGWGAFLGTLLGIGLKIAFCGAVLFFYLKEVF